MLERLSYESTPMNSENIRLISIAEKYAKMAIEAADESRFDDAIDNMVFFGYVLKTICSQNALDYVAVEIDNNGYPHIKLDNEFGDFEKYYYYFAPPFSGWVEEIFFSERKKRLDDYWQEFHYPLSCLVTYNKIED